MVKHSDEWTDNPVNNGAGTPWDSVSVVIVTYNSSRVIGDCLKSVAPAKQVIVVDNASTDTTCDEILRVLPSARIIRNKTNKGFGTAVNQGMAVVETEFGFYFSPDAVLGDDAMPVLIAAARRNPGAAMLGPYLRRPDGQQELYVMGPGEIYHTEMQAKPAGDFCTWFVMGGFFLCRIAAWRRIGGFDERIFLYVEDVDLSLRTIQAGYSLVIVPGAEVIHAGGQSSTVNWVVKWRKDWHQTWSRLYHEAKHGNAQQARAEARRIAWRHAAKTVLYALFLRPDRVRGNCAKACGAWAFLCGKPAQRP